MKQDWLNEFNLTSLLSTEEQSLLNTSIYRKGFSVGEYIFQDGDPCQHVILVESGRIRIQKLSEDGHMLTLGRLGKARCCNLSVTSAIGGKKYPAEAIAEENSELILIPAGTVKKLLSSSTSWQFYLFNEISQHFIELILLAEDVAFVPIEVRLAKRLIEGAGKDKILKETHSEIASDLGSAREVISRTLKRFERLGYIKLSRGKIEIIRPYSLKNIFH